MEPNSADPNDVQLLSAIRAGELDSVKDIASSWSSSDFERLYNSNVFPLHLAAMFGQLDVMKYLVDDRGIDINQKNQDGNTSLHLASSQGHTDVIKWLLSQPKLDDTIMNNELKDAMSCAHSQEIASLILDDRSTFVKQNTTEAIRLAKENDFESFKNLYSSPRVEQLVGVNAREPSTGTTPLHEAARANNLDATTWLTEHRADILASDNSGKIPHDLATDPKIKELLSETTLHSNTNQPERLQGVLKKWTNLASGFRKRFFVLADGKISYYKSPEEVGKVCRGEISLKDAKVHWKEGSTWFEVESIDNKFELRASHAVEAKKWVLALLAYKEERSSTITGKSPLLAAGTKTKPRVTHRIRNSLQIPTHRRRISVASLHSGKTDDSAPETPKSDSLSTPTQTAAEDSPPNGTCLSPSLKTDSSLRTTLLNLDAQIEEQKKLISSTIQGRDKESFDNISISPENFSPLMNNLLESLNTQSNLIHDALQLESKKDAQWKQVAHRQFEKEAFWRDNLESLAKDHLELEGVLRKQSYLNKSQKALGDIPNEDKVLQVPSGEPAESSDGPEVCISDDEEDFFDADEGLDTQVTDSHLEQRQPNGIPATTSTSESNTPKDAASDITTAFIGYPKDGKFRDRLEMSGEVIPDISIWSILKNSVGKDLSKIAVPVEFNESTSMLQRMCEDMEYSTLLDIAVKQESSAERMLWVAAFAMSNYSSTLGRTGKPFNPLLGETFEYVRPDRGFRYVSEQVSHHPPISACYCESPNYEFQAEVNLVSKFWGKSFELNPKGVTHLHLKIPGSDVKEHYSWKKVTSAMNNIIIGTMYIEHYGDMIITNHQTGEECILTFQRTGWRSSNKHVIRGKIHDAKGREIWEIGGRWDDKLVARRVGINDGQDIITNGEAISKPDYHPGDGTRPVLLWKMSPRPNPKLAYNLTQFAVSLNELPSDLVPYLPPTDSRHRPDQKAMERGDFSAANDLKVELEGNQRKRRKKLESNGITFQPRWFTKEVDADTNAPIWTFDHQYWQERYRCGTEKAAQSGPGNWDRVDPIFE